VRIAVLGGGPAGSAAALRLARSGTAVDLYMPARPGEKPCGGAVPEHVLPELAGFDPGPLPAVRSPCALLENGRGSRIDLALTGLRIFRRVDLDAALAAAALAAGACRAAGRAERVEGGPGGVRVTVGVTGGSGAGKEVREYDWAIGADGAGGLARRAAGLGMAAGAAGAAGTAGVASGMSEEERLGRSVGLGASLSGLAWDRLVLAFPGEGDAYAWIFPRPGGASVGIAYTACGAGGVGGLREAAARALLDTFLDRHLPAGWRELPGPRYRYPIPVFGPWTLPGVRRGLKKRLLLAGDAAALADPLTREGIRYALLSGTWAAESLLQGGPASYPEKLEAELAGEMERARSARDLFFDGPIGQWMVPVARLHPGIRQVLGDLLSCRQPYRGLKRRLLASVLSW
jgi:flavin-dependent dehydrogenase